MNALKSTAYLLVVLLFMQCSTDDQMHEPIDPYTECCSKRPVEFKFGSYEVYVPSAFTPNGDGVNDLFFPFPSSNIIGTGTFSISTLNLGIMYIASGMDMQNPLASAWDGRDADGNLYAGPFNYGLEFLDDNGFPILFTGSACSILCDSFAVTINSKTDCFFPAQHDGQGGLDANLPILEEDCF